MRSVTTFTAVIYCGLRERYDGELHGRDDALAIVQRYVDSVGLCVAVSECEFVYTNGREPGIVVSLMNYPRFTSMDGDVLAHALVLAKQLASAMGQFRVSIVTSKETITLEACDAKE